MHTFFIRVPHVVFRCRVPTQAMPGHKWQDLTTQEIFTGRRTAIFAVPGAFTPTCTSTHLPGFEEKYFELRAQGIDDVYCVSVNDSYVMNAWFNHLGIQNVKALPDGTGEFARKMGFLIDKSNLGFGMRSWRYSAVIRDNVVEMMWVEPGFRDNSDEDPFVTSDANTMLDYLKKPQQ